MHKTVAETPLTPSEVTQQKQEASKEGYIKRVLVAEDQALNVIADGKPDETISARSGRAAAKGKWFGRFMCWWLDKLQPNHGEKAEAGDLERAEIVEKTEEAALDTKQGSH